MILTGNEIEVQMALGNIRISPFSKDALNPNSYNFHLGPSLLVYTNEILDPREQQPTREIPIPDDGVVLAPGELYLGNSVETMGSTSYVPLIFGRSSIGRLGIYVQITAPLGDIGFLGQWTLQLSVVKPVKVYAGMRIGQILFIAAQGEISLYQGKYQDARAPRASEIFRDFR